MALKGDRTKVQDGNNRPPALTIAQIPSQRTGYNPPPPAAPGKPIITPPPPKKE